MDRLTVTLKTVTPMFLGGADGKTPELRVPSIKGMMRFWWRAINSHLSIEELRKEEGGLFGSSDEGVGRSKFALMVRRTDEIKVIPYQPLPHHTGNESCEYLAKAPSCKKNDNCSKGFQPSAIAPDKTFECIIRTSGEYIAQVQDIFKISLILGGLGRRSRRGFGSIKIIKVNGSDFSFDYSPTSICNLLNAVVPNGFKVDGNKITRSINAHADADYPYIEEIEIGSGCKKHEDLLKVIGRSSHKNDCDHTGFVDMDRKKRFSSPIYVSVIEVKGVYKPIITKLHTFFEDNNYPRTCSRQTCNKSAKFISDILTQVAGDCK